ncbi:imidazole glycerol phosphate synthase subunit HisH [Candidatus Fermentibacteria bacterium]|nr:imidazole glycerol phosphate synthase subunit HisH [Candidatus Fermentibacteria bacterium]
MTEATVVDYGAGNLKSVEIALGRLGCRAIRAATPGDIGRARRIILPGVGSFSAGMTALVSSGMDDALREAAERGTPILGICLGMQMLMERGAEGGCSKGLGLLAGGVVPLIPGRGLAMPHMGWNSVSITRRVGILDGVRDGACFYFAHSYVVEPSDPGVVCAVTEHGWIFPSVVSSGVVSGVQFHPEKSRFDGAALLGGFLAKGRER